MTTRARVKAKPKVEVKAEPKVEVEEERIGPFFVNVYEFAGADDFIDGALTLAETVDETVHRFLREYRHKTIVIEPAYIILE